MDELYEFRLNERFVSLLSAPDIGIHIGTGTGLGSEPFIRLVKVRVTDAMFAEIGVVDARLRATQRRSLFFSWNIKRSYTQAEIDSAELFHVFIANTFEPAGEECGTRYDGGLPALHVELELYSPPTCILIPANCLVAKKSPVQLLTNGSFRNASLKSSRKGSDRCGIPPDPPQSLIRGRSD